VARGYTGRGLTGERTCRTIACLMADSPLLVTRRLEEGNAAAA
jgi:hypothetical protein